MMNVAQKTAGLIKGCTKLPRPAISCLSALLTLCFLHPRALAQDQQLDSLLKANRTYLRQDTNKARIIYRIADSYVNTAPDSAMLYAKTGLSLVNKLKWDKGISAFYTCIGRLLSNNGDNTEAIRYYQLAYGIHKKLGNQYNMATDLNNIGSAYQRLSIFPEALSYTIDALKIAETIDNAFLMALCNNNISNIYFAQENYAKALTYIFSSLKISEKEKNRERMASTYDNIGNIYSMQKNRREAEKFYNKALTLYQEIHNRTGEATAISHLALLYDDQKDKKLDLLLRAQAIFDTTNPKYPVSITNTGNIGGTYADIIMHDSVLKSSIQYRFIPKERTTLIQRAKAYLNKAIAYSRETDDPDNLNYYSDNLAQLQEYLGDYKNALANFKLSKKINDSLYSQETKNKIAEFDARRAFEKKESIYKQQQQLSELKLRQLWLYAILTILVICTVLIYLLNRYRIKQLQLKNTLQQQEAEQRAKELIHRTKISESELKAIRSQMNPHFIFNVLNSIESYILENDPKTASRLVQKFAALSRLILENSTQSLVIAEREWKALQLYTELEAMRYGNSFSYTFETAPGLGLGKLFIPPMLVQPLIENAIHHGLRPELKADSQLAVKMEQQDAQIIFTVTDNGIGLKKASSQASAQGIKEKSMGLAAIQDRIEMINLANPGKPAKFGITDLTEQGGRGTLAILTVPLIRAEDQ